MLEQSVCASFFPLPTPTPDPVSERNDGHSSPVVKRWSQSGESND